MDRLLSTPYGVQSFNVIREDDYAYVDKTGYIELLEKLKVVFPFIVRPRRFGKTLLTSVLQAYYDHYSSDDFEKFFKGTYIYDHKTDSQGQFYVLKLGFAGLCNDEDTKRRFIAAIKDSLSTFFLHYPMDGDDELLAHTFLEPDELLREFCKLVNPHIGRKLYVIIDEYDQFTGEMLAKDVGAFKNLTSKGGWLKNFYTALKDATENTVARVFITGVTSISLDSMTSGFNIAENITFDPHFAGMFGFTEAELREFIPRVIDVEKYGHSIDEIVERMQDYFNGYAFSTESDIKVFNPSNCIYYLRNIARNNREPMTLLDPAIAPDLSKIHGILSLGDEAQAKEIVTSVLSGKSIPMPSFEQALNLNSQNRFTYSQLLSVLVYMGFLTLSPGDLHTLHCPNKAIKTQFFQYYFRYLEGLDSFGIQSDEVKSSLDALCAGNPQPLLEMVALKFKLSMGFHSYAHFSESNYQTAIQFAVGYSSDFKVEVERELPGIGYADLILVPKDNSHAVCAYLIELKYLKAGASPEEIAGKLEEARAQLKRYADSDVVKSLGRVKMVAAVYSGAALAACEVC